MNYSPVPMPPVADPNRQQNQFITPMPPLGHPNFSSPNPPGYLGPPVAQPINPDVAPIVPKFSAIPLNPPAPSQNQGLAQWMSNYMQHTGFHGPTGMPVFTHEGKHYIPQVAQGDPLTTNPDIGGTPMPPTHQPAQPFAYQTFQNALNASGRGTFGTPGTMSVGGFEEPALPTNPGPHNELGLDPGGTGYPSGTLPPSGSEPPPDGTGSNDYGPNPTPTPPPNGAWTDPNGNVWNPGAHQYIAPSGQITIDPGDHSNDPRQPWEDQPPDDSGIGTDPSMPRVGGPRTGSSTSSGPGNISTTPGFLGNNQYYNWGTGHVYGLHNQGGFLRNFGGEQQIRDPNKFGYNGTGDAGRLINVNASHRDTDPAMRNYLRAWSAAHSSIFQPGMQRGG